MPQRFFQQASPLAQEFIAVDAEIHRLFESILTKRKLGRKSRTDILNLYHSLQFMGLLSPKLNDESEPDSIFEDFDPDSIPGQSGDDFPPHRHQSDQEEPDSAEAFSKEPHPKSPSSRQMRQTL